jgi:hypothetical protein
MDAAIMNKGDRWADDFAMWESQANGPSPWREEMRSWGIRPQVHSKHDRFGTFCE